MGCDGLPQKRRAALRLIPLKAVLVRLIVHRYMERSDHRTAQRQGDVPDAQMQEPLAGMSRQISRGLFRNTGEEVTGLQFFIVQIGDHHSNTSPSYTSSAGPVMEILPSEDT